MKKKSWKGWVVFRPDGSEIYVVSTNQELLELTYGKSKVIPVTITESKPPVKRKRRV